VDTKTFALAQEISAGRTVRRTNEQLLQKLRSLLVAKGKISNKIIDRCAEMPSARTYWYRFGGLRRASELIGYDMRKSGRKSDVEMLQHLRSLLASHGRLSKPIIDEAPRLVSSHKFRWRFGRLDRAYELIGYDWKKDLSKAKRENIKVPNR
jgi:hypothetical protein